jgi:high-affinity iron transporter
MNGAEWNGAGLWLGLFPTWQGLLAQTAALVFVVGSYLAAESMQKRRRARLVATTVSVQSDAASGARAPGGQAHGGTPAPELR